ncbi:MAG: helix-turn-helix domain-containing protein [Pseudomonadota bacterium]
MGWYRHLSRDDRDQIAEILAAGLPQSRIAPDVGKSKFTISRELRRNALDNGGYSAAIADGAYMDGPIGLRCWSETPNLVSS